VPDVQNSAHVVDPAPERDHVPAPAVQNPDPAPVFPEQNHVPQVSTNQAAQPQGNTVSLDINYDNFKNASVHKLMLYITFIFFTLCGNTSFPSSTSRLQGF
jgi:hypothetical protein